MPRLTSRTSRRGKELLKAVKDSETEKQAARTALAVARYRALLVEERDIVRGDSIESPNESSSVQTAEVYWIRHDRPNLEYLSFSRANGEIISIRTAPVDEGWIIRYQEPGDNWPS